MSRLIDANSFKRFLQALCKAGAPYNEVIQLIDKEPTAYDVEKVVAMMDEALVEFKDGTNCTECVFKDVCDDGYEGCTDTMVAVCKGVVRKGGVE